MGGHRHESVRRGPAASVRIPLVICLLAGLTVSPAFPRSWESLGPDGGDRFMVRVSPGTPGTVFVAGHHAIHRSRDNGEAWERVNNAEMSRDSFLDLAIDPARPWEIFAAGTFGGVWYSPDEGDTWEPRSAGLPMYLDWRYYPLTSLIILPGGELLVGVSSSAATAPRPSAVYRSGDRGRTWTPEDGGIVLAPGVDVVVSLLSLDVSGRAWALVNGAGVYLRNGWSWVARSGNIPVEASQGTFLAHDPASPDRLVLGTQTSWTWETRDGGLSWARLSLPENLEGLAVLPLVYTVVTDPANPDLLMVRTEDTRGSPEQPIFQPAPTQNAGGGTYFSADRGSTWVRQPMYPFRVAADPSETVEDVVPGFGPVRRSRTWFWTAGGVRSLMRSSDGMVTAEPKTKGIETMWMNQVWVHPSPPPGEAPLVVGASEAGLFRRSGEEGGWTLAQPATSSLYTWSLATDYADPDAILYATGNPAWTTPEDRGAYRMPMTCFDEPCDPAANQILASTGLWSLTTTPARPGRIVAAGQSQGVLFSDNGGAAWAELNLGLALPVSVTDIELDAAGVPFLAAYRTSSGDPEASPPQPWSPQADEAGGVYEFRAATGRWSRHLGLSAAVYNLEAPSGRSGPVYAATSTGVYRLIPGGGWELISEPMLVHDVAVDPTRPSHLYAATRDGVLRTTNGGTQWHDVSAGLPVPIVDALQFDADGTLYAATEGAGIVRLRPDPNPLPAVAADPPSLDFGRVPVGFNRVLRLILANAGEADLTITALTVSAPEFVLVSPPVLPVTLTPGSWIDLGVRFLPSSPFGASAMITVTYNAGTTPKLVWVRGQGYAETGTFSLTVDPPNAGWLVDAPWGGAAGRRGNLPPVQVPTGTYTLTWRPLEGYDPPTSEPLTVVIEPGGSAQVTGTYQPVP